MADWRTIGHERAVAALRRGIGGGRVAHAYLLVGPPQVGKMSLAMDLARMVNCLAEPADARPCGECAQCRRISDALHADVRVVSQDGGSGARNAIGVDQIRDLQQEANLKPYEGRYRVFIIDGAERFTQEAANALLKMLEEPPADVLFVLLASEVSESSADESMSFTPYTPAGVGARQDKIAELLEIVPRVGGVLPTIISRCQVLELRPLPIAQVAEVIEQRFNLDTQPALEIARLSGGRIGKALEFATSSELLAEHAERMDTIEDVLRSGLAERFAYAERRATAFGRDRSVVYGDLSLWLAWWRDVLVVKSGSGGFATNLSRMDALRTAAADCDAAQVVAAIRAIQETDAMLRANVNARLALEGMLLRMPRVSPVQDTCPSNGSHSP